MIAKTRLILLGLLLFCGLCAPLNVTAQSAKMPSNPSSGQNDWWKHAVLYEIYPRSYADSDNDGTGDLKGIVGKLDYLQSLGVDAIWITPMFPSPLVDFGYDVSDYEAVDSRYGSLADMDRLIAEAKRRGIKVILDLVVNHTSDQHAWFKDSRASRESKYRDFYVWRDGKGEGIPPNNWQSIFGGSAWEYDATTKQWYLHQFYKEQPDLNWRNPAVEKAVADAAAWWFRRGIYGFRLDAVDTLYEDPQLRDNPVAAQKGPNGEPQYERTYTIILPDVHAALQRLRASVDAFPGRVLVGETWTSDPAELNGYYGPKNNELHMPMYLELTRLPSLSAAEFRSRIDAVEANSVGGWPTFALSNHDIRRAVSRYTPEGANSDDVGKLIGALLLTLRGTPVLYYGEELGMENNDPTRIEDVQDANGRRGWPNDKGRDGERTPMRWTGSTNAGFNTGAKPWLPVGSDYAMRNVATESADPKSVLTWYRALIRLRRESPAFGGDYTSVLKSDPDVMGYLRVSATSSALVLLNMSATAKTVTLADASVSKVRSVLLANGAKQDGASVRLEPFGVFVADAERATK